MQKLDKRYSVWRVFVWVLAIWLFFQLLGIFVIVFLKLPDQPYKLEDAISFKANLQFVISVVYTTVFFYFTLNYYNKLLVDKKKALSYFIYSVIVFVISCGYYLLSSRVFAGVMKTKHPVSFGLMLFSSVFMSIFFIGISLLIAYFNNLRDDKKQRKVLEMQNLQANYNFLKAQINPHFLHNTLNFFYAKSLPYSEELSEGILTLSEIMRYALSKENAIDGKILLKDEVEHLRNVIKINQMRFSNKLNLVFDVHGILGDAMIIPFVLITIVENAFKHGDLKNAEHPIDIQLTVKDDKLTFYCRNKKKTGPKELSTGIGLENTKKRLDVVYNNQYTFNVKDEGDFYTTELTINKL